MYTHGVFFPNKIFKKIKIFCAMHMLYNILILDKFKSITILVLILSKIKIERDRIVREYTHAYIKYLC